MTSRFVSVLPLLSAAWHINLSAAPGSLDVTWTAGSADCESSAPPPLQVHRYDAATYILRQDACMSYEANFLYLLAGSEKALLIDTGAVEDAREMPLAETVMGLLPKTDDRQRPLIVVHTHGHSDHRQGDSQLGSLPFVQVVPVELEELRQFFGFDDWPEGSAAIELGERTVDVLPAPGHHPAHLVFHDRTTGIVFTGDFLLPGRLVVKDLGAYRASALRIVDFLEGRAVTYILGSHVELDSHGRLFSRGSNHHPDERRLQLERADLLALPDDLASFNGFYAVHQNYVITNPLRNLLALVIGLFLVLGLLAWAVRRTLGTRRRAS